MTPWTRTCISVFGKEFRRMAQSPLLFAFWTVGLFLAGLYFTIGLSLSPEPNLRIQSLNMCLTLLFVVPLMSMQSFSGEERNGTLEMLLTFPIPLSALIVGKFLSLFLLTVGLIALSSLNVLVIVVLGTPDWGAVIGGLLAQILASAMYISVGLFTSVLTREPIAAGLGGMVLLLPFWMVDLLVDGVESSMVRTLLTDFSLVGHLQPMSKGLIDSVDVLWFVMMSIVFLWLTNLVLEAKRWR